MNAPLVTSRLIVLALIGLLSAPTFPAFAQTANLVLSFPSVAALRAYNTAGFASTVPQALTGGYYAAGDEGGNQFYWAASSTAADNGGTVIRPSAIASGSPGRWLATANSAFNVKTFGAIGNDSTNNDTAFANAMAALPSTGGIINIGPGKFVLQNLTITKSNVHIVGAGKGTTVLKFQLGTSLDGLIQVQSIDYWSVSNLTIDYAGTTVPSGAGGYTAMAAIRSNHWSIHDIHILAMPSYGIFVNGGSYWTIEKVFISRSSATGVTQNQSIIVSSDGDDVSYAAIRNTISVNSGILFSGHDSTLADNRTMGTGYGAGIAITDDARTYRNQISRNVCVSGRGLDVNNTIVEGFEIWGPNHIVSDNTAWDNDGTGFTIAGQHTIVSSNLAYANGKYSGGGHGDGFVALSASYSLFVGNIAYDPAGAAGTQSYGLQESNSSLTGIIYRGNNFSGNKVGDALYRINAGSRNDPTIFTVTLDLGGAASGSFAAVGGQFVAGLNPGEKLHILKPAGLPPGVFFDAEVEFTNSVRITMYNFTGSSCDPPSIDYVITRFNP